MVVVSGHWEERVPTVGTAEHPALIYDYYGFLPETYQLQWPAAGAPALADRVADLLRNSGLPVASDSPADWITAFSCRSKLLSRTPISP